MKHLFLLAIVFGISATTIAQNKLGGHFGMVHPLITFSDGETTSISDNYVVGFPTGINIGIKENLAFDVEIVPFIEDGKMNNLLFHPGVLFGLGSGFTFGNRLAFETGSQAYGFTPLLNKSFSLGENGAFFLELVLPVRFGKIELPLGGEDRFSALTVGLHTGIAF
ncbi:hypothetical protein [Ekhidna sp.]